MQRASSDLRSSMLHLPFPKAPNNKRDCCKMKEESHKDVKNTTECSYTSNKYFTSIFWFSTSCYYLLLAVRGLLQHCFLLGIFLSIFFGIYYDCIFDINLRFIGLYLFFFFFLFPFLFGNSTCSSMINQHVHCSVDLEMGVLFNCVHIVVL